ncbi:hypothetical protein [Cohnella yongneupensis]|uniref:Uncharacterized protein n=1 Tax=Cohnella yongneupensis TaxID=425006 RepID=A0ABW0R0R2_9BACL
MNERLNQLEQRLIEEDHKDLFLQMKHTLQAITELEEKHRVVTAKYGIHGYKVVGSEEVMFSDTLDEVRELIVQTLEKTLDDLIHEGHKHHEKNFKDGIE